jgi:hypothetical protein
MKETSLRSPMSAALLPLTLVAVPVSAQQNCEQDRIALGRLRAEAERIDSTIAMLPQMRAKFAGMNDQQLQQFEAQLLERLRTQPPEAARETRIGLDLVTDARARKMALPGFGAAFSPEQSLQKRRTYLANQIQVIRDRFDANHCAACNPAGQWSMYIEELGPSTLIIDADGSARDTVNHAGGPATMAGQTLTIVWATPDGAAGTMTTQINTACSEGRGVINWTKAPEGLTTRSYDVSLRRRP